MNPVIRKLGSQDYLTTLQAMQNFTVNRNDATDDELWVVEHPPVYTLGLNAKTEHLLNAGAIPVIQTDRGGQVTYHGPGQVIVYTLLNIKRLQLNIRQLVSVLEQAMLDALQDYAISAYAKKDAPGVYVQNQKIGSVGLRIKNNCCYHGLSLNNNMDLQPFRFINPCGYAGLEMTQLVDLNVYLDTAAVADSIIAHLTLALTS